MLGSWLDLKPRDVPLRVAARNTLAVVAPLAFGIATGHLAPALAVSTGALNTMFTDQPGPYRLRLQRMLLAALAAGTAALAGIVLGSLGADWPLVAASFAVAFGGGFLVAIGPMAARVGLTSIIVLLVTASMGIAPAHAPGVAALIAAGGLLQATLAIAAWPLQRYRPERFALADLMQQLARAARERPDAAQQPAASQAAMDALVLLHGDYRSRGEAMRAFRILAEVGERARIDVLALSDLHARLEGNGARAAVAALLDAAAEAFAAFAAGLRAAQPAAGSEAFLARFAAATAALEAARADAGAADARLLRIALSRAESLGGQLRSLARNSAGASSRGEAASQRAEARLPPALRTTPALPTLRANLRLDSVAFRHALRCAVAVALATALSRALGLAHGVWIPMTAAIVLKPDFGGTLRFGVLRVAGTLAGLLLTTVLAHWAMGDPWLRLGLLAALCLGFRLLVTVHYGLGVALLTGLVVLLLSFRGMAPAAAVEARVVATLAGSALALAAYALWPTWEARRLPAALANLVDAYRAHLAAVLDGRIGDVAQTRAAARLARTNAQASLARLRAEPAGRRPVADLRRTEAILANASRLVRAGVALEALLRDGASLPRDPTLATFAACADRSLEAIAAALRDARGVELPSLREDERNVAAALAGGTAAQDPVGLAVADACDRIADSVDTLAHLARPASPPAAG